MKTLRKNSKYKFPDGITRKITEVERRKGNNWFTNSDYACYSVDIPFEGDDLYFEKYSHLYEEVIKMKWGINTPPSKYIGPLLPGMTNLYQQIKNKNNENKRTKI